MRVIDQHISSFSQLADVLVELFVARFVVRGVDEHFVFGLKPEPQAPLWMVEPHALNRAIIEGGAESFIEIHEFAVGRHFVHVHGEIRVGHLLFNRTLQAHGAAGRVEDK